MLYHPFFDFLVLGTCMLAGIIFSFTGFRLKNHKIYSSFGLTSLLLFIHYGLVEIVIFYPGIENYLFITKISYIFGGFFFMSLLWFTFYYTKAKERKWLYFMSAYTLFMMICSTYRPFLYFDSIDAVEVVDYHHADIYIVEGTRGIWNDLLIVYLATISSTYLFWSWKAYKRDKTRNSLITMLLNLLMVISVINDNILISYFGIPSTFIRFHVFFLLIVVMSLQLSDEILDGIAAKDHLATKEKQWQLLLENIKLLVVAVDENETINYCNRFFTSMTGFSSQELQGKPTSFLQSRIKTSTVFASSPLPQMIHTKQGIPKNIDWWPISLTDQQGNHCGNIILGADRTEINQYQQQQDQLIQRLRKLEQQLKAENFYLKSEISLSHSYENIIGQSPQLKQVLHKLEQVAPTDTTVLIEGETGVGKELFAHSVYQQSQRNGKVFIKVNCAALPKDLIESELFGHEKGAFTGATHQRKGRFEIANNGTLFLDEIGELPLELQPKLLRVLQSGEFERLGGEKPVKVDVRIIAATNRNLINEVKKGNFREDLFYRLNVYPVTIPPLRERREDIPLLVEFLVHKYAAKMHKKISQISPHLLKELSAYHWPGNIRELQNVLERAVIVSANNKLILADSLSNQQNISKDVALKTMQDMERIHIQSVLLHCNNKIEGPNGAAEILNLKPSTLRSKIKKLEIER